MDYQKLLKYVEVTTKGGETATDGARTVLELEHEKTIHADKLVPFHAVDKAVSETYTASATRPDPYCGDGGGDMECVVILDEPNAQINRFEQIPGYVSCEIHFHNDIHLPYAMTVTVDGVKTVLPKQTVSGTRNVYYATEPIGSVPGNPSIITTDNEGYMSTLIFYAKEEDVSPGRHSMTIEACNIA